MNHLTYKFSKEIEQDLLVFLQRVKNRKSTKNCDLDAHKVWKTLLPGDPVLIQKLQENETEEVVLIDLVSDEESLGFQEAGVGVVNEENDNLEKSSVMVDLAFAIRENLEINNGLSDNMQINLGNRSVNDLHELFNSLKDFLNNEQMFYLGAYIETSASTVLITSFCHYLLVPKCLKEYCIQIANLVSQYSTKEPLILKEECLLQLPKLSDEEIKMLLQYVKHFNPLFRSMLLRDITFNITTLNNTYLLIMQNLLTKEVEYEILNKIVELSSNIANDYCQDKCFGKLLTSVIESLGHNLVLLQQPLKHIIAGHKSVWRTKLEKLFAHCYEHSLIYSQGFTVRF